MMEYFAGKWMFLTIAGTCNLTIDCTKFECDIVPWSIPEESFQNMDLSKLIIRPWVFVSADHPVQNWCGDFGFEQFSLSYKERVNYCFFVRKNQSVVLPLPEGYPSSFNMYYGRVISEVQHLTQFHNSRRNRGMIRCIQSGRSVHLSHFPVDLTAVTSLRGIYHFSFIPSLYDHIWKDYTASGNITRDCMTHTLESTAPCVTRVSEKGRGRRDSFQVQ